MSAALIPITTLDEKTIWINPKQIISLQPTQHRVEWGSADLSDTITIALRNGGTFATREDITELAGRINRLVAGHTIVNQNIRTPDTKGTTHD